MRKRRCSQLDPLNFSKVAEVVKCESCFFSKYAEKASHSTADFSRLADNRSVHLRFFSELAEKLSACGCELSSHPRYFSELAEAAAGRVLLFSEVAEKSVPRSTRTTAEPLEAEFSVAALNSALD
jgi:hypothetical protein